MGWVEGCRKVVSNYVDRWNDGCIASAGADVWRIFLFPGWLGNDCRAEKRSQYRHSHRWSRVR